jgi:predicted glycoside hydrolase/deacetylase ChbG (UPF0249 family)
MPDERSPRPPRLVVNADDFGVSAGVNRGILEAHAAGVVSSVSVLVNAPGWADARATLPAASATLGVGLHLNLTADAPVASGARTLVSPRTGRFHPLRVVVARALAGGIDPGEVAAECAAQLARLRETGVAVTHLDSHRHVHVLPGIWGAVVETARREGVRFVRVPLEPLAARAASWRALLKGAALGAAWRVAARGVALPPVAHADHFHGIALQGDRRFAGRLVALLDRLAPGLTELMVHPGHPDAALAAWDGYTAPRAVELAALTSPAVRARFQQGAFRLVTFAAP